MMNIKAKLLATSLLSLSALFSTASFANDDQAKAKAEFEAMKKEYTTAMKNAGSSSNVRDGLIKACAIPYKQAVKYKKLTQSDVNKLCTCEVDAEGKLTQAQKWQIQSTINQKKNPATLAFVEKQNQDLEACFGPQLTNKLKTLASKKP
ncbi:hypothetical protein ACX2CK_11230 [Acinetobacter schindleri]